MFKKFDFDFDFDFDFYFKILNQSQIIRWRAPRPCGACPTQPYKCGQNVKVKIRVGVDFDGENVGAENFGFAEINKFSPYAARRLVLTLILKY